MNALVRGVGLALVFALALTATAEDKKDEKKGKKEEKVELPKKVEAALKAKFPKYKITKATKEKEGGVLVYDIEFTVDGKKFEADIKEDGTIVNWEKDIPVKDLPFAVKKAILAKYPGCKVVDAAEVTAVKGAKEELEGYEVNLVTAAKKKVEVTVSPAGKILEDSSEKKGEKDKKDEKKDK
jgi:hypothetical protein